MRKTAPGFLRATLSREHLPLGCAFLLALGLRLIIPLHIAANSAGDDMTALRALAAGRGANEVGFTTSLLYHASIGIGLLRPINNRLYTPYWSISLLQGVADSFGVLLVFLTVSSLSTRRNALWGALIYALWLPSIFYASQALTEGGLPVVLLALSFCMVKAFTSDRRILWLLAAGASTGAALLLRFDNGLIAVFLPAFIAWRLRRDKAESLTGSLAFLCGTAAFGLFFVLCLARVTGVSHSLAFRSSRDAAAPSLALALYNSLGEYPATYPGLRFFKDEPAFKHMAAKAEALSASGDRSFAVLSRVLPGDPHLAAFAAEVVVGHPGRYAGWIALRTLRFLPSHRFFAAIATILLKPSETPEMTDKYGRWFLKGRPVSNSQFGFRSSPVYRALRCLDLALFSLFVLGAFALRRSSAALSLLCIYLGALIGHVFTQTGDVLYIDNAPWEFLEPRYLIGMVSIWPLFLPMGVGFLRDSAGRARPIS